MNDVAIDLPPIPIHVFALQPLLYLNTHARIDLMQFGHDRGGDGCTTVKIPRDKIRHGGDLHAVDMRI